VAPRTVDFLQKYGLPYLAKPFLVEELKDAVARSLNERSGVPSNSMKSLDGEAARGPEQSHRRRWKRYEL
jgi:DNA-binding NtrC family response regulator